MAKEKNAKNANLKTYTVEAVTGKKTTVGKIKLPTMTIDAAGEALSKLLNQAAEDGATSVRGTITVYKANE